MSKTTVLRLVSDEAPASDIGTVSSDRPQPPRRRRNDEVRAREHLIPDEVERLMKTARKRGRYGQRDAAMILIAYHHGLRVSELVGLRWRDIDLDHARMMVRRLKGSDAGAHPLAGDELRALRQVRREWGDKAGYVFLTERDAPMSAAGFRKMLARTGDEAGLTAVHPHQLRHGCGYALVDRGVDIRTVQAYMGHKAITSTTVYTALSPRRFEGLWD
jgi:type 1 fimbriae regulatory protein FimB/type 1 fimbriae regulatory protein FimE